MYTTTPLHIIGVPSIKQFKRADFKTCEIYLGDTVYHIIYYNIVSDYK